RNPRHAGAHLGGRGRARQRHARPFGDPRRVICSNRYDRSIAHSAIDRTEPSKDGQENLLPLKGPARSSRNQTIGRLLGSGQTCSILGSSKLHASDQNQSATLSGWTFPLVTAGRNSASAT